MEASRNAFLPEVPINLSLNLKRHSTATEKMATFTCITSKPHLQVTWFKDSMVIFPCRKYVVVQEGCQHTLTIRSLGRPDYGEYVVVVGKHHRMGGARKEGLLEYTFFYIFYLHFDFYRIKLHGVIEVCR